MEALIETLSEMPDYGVGPNGLGIIILLAIWLIIWWKYYDRVVKYYQSELERISKERDKWENRFFGGKLLSSNDDHYTAKDNHTEGEPSPKDKDALEQKDNSVE